MSVRQISIFLENRTGRLAEITGILGDHGINIRALSLADTADFGILRLIVDDQEKAKTVLREEGFTYGETEVLAVEVPDVPGGLARILKALTEEQVNVEYMYAFVMSPSRSAVMVFRFEDPQQALGALAKHDIRTLTGKTLYGI
jgi:hypothetical protein